MDITIQPIKQKYFEREKKDIKQYGRHKCVRYGVTDETLEKFTPFRRLSNKPCSMSDPDYYINKFGETTKESLPSLDNWDNLSKEEKGDLIVKSRYRRLVAQRIMNNSIDDVEHSYSIGENGSIMAYDKGEDEHVNIKNYKKASKKAEIKRQSRSEQPFAHIIAESPVTAVHNHPSAYKTFEKDFGQEKLMEYGINQKIEEHPFSSEDIIGDVNRRTDSYVIDTNKNKYYFSSRKMNPQVENACEDFFITTRKLDMYYQGRVVVEHKKYDRLKKLVQNNNFFKYKKKMFLKKWQNICMSKLLLKGI